MEIQEYEARGRCVGAEMQIMRTCNEVSTCILGFGGDGVLEGGHRLHLLRDHEDEAL
jgi:hypothetical protein